MPSIYIYLLEHEMLSSKIKSIVMKTQKLSTQTDKEII